MVDLTRRNLMERSVAAALGATVVGSGVASASASEIPETETEDAPSLPMGGELKRFANTAFGAEVTGPYVFDDGALLFSNQHPDETNQGEFKNPGVGYFSGFNFDLDGDNDDFAELDIPDTKDKQERIRASEGEYVYLAQGREPINDGKERLGVTQTPDGTDITLDNFEGTQYGAAATNPDCNQFVAANDEGTEGYLYTNWENSPGNVSRIPLEKDEDGEWEADLEDAVNLANTDELRALGGTRINCYGDKTPWDTMVSSEENYAHPRVTFTNTVSDVVENGGAGLTGACQFWNRPNPSEVGSGDWFTEYNDGVYTQGAFALAGVEFLAYYLGAEQVDQGDDENTYRPIDDVYPNPYRYGYHLEFREDDGGDPVAIKHYVMGRASWEAPDFQNDHKTVYGCSDGDSKGIYKFVADDEIDAYDDPMDIAGTLYAPKITNTDETTAEDPRSSPAEVNLEVEWIPLGHASNGELEEAIAQYDDVTQADYLEAHADSQGWRSIANSDNPGRGKGKANAREKLAEAIDEADREVIENGNRNYVTNEEIVEWAEQWAENGHDGVDDDLKHVPFLETRAAAKEVGASIEFNKAEGIDSTPDADDEGGSYIYVGISEFNDDLADETGDIQMDRVDGGVVYRAEIEEGYDISTLEPVIVGPDFLEDSTEGNDALRNIDNVYVMADGRVLCCEDGFAEPSREYPNDCLYVYAP